MTDALKDLVKAAPKRPRFGEFPLDEFLLGKAMWAANFFVLWPAGVALTVDVEVVPVDPLAWCGSDETHGAHETGVEAEGTGVRCLGATATGEVTNLHVREWVFPEGELGETIDATDGENQADFRRFLAFVHERFVSMKPDDRRLLLKRYDRFQIATAEQILLAVEP